MFRILLALTLMPVAMLALPQAVQNMDYTVSVSVELVQLPVSVVDKKGNPVRGLKPEHFSIYEDKVLQDISLFKQEDVPLSVGLVIDASSSMREKQDRVNTAALTFVRESNPEDETFIVSFADEATLEQDFTSDPGELSRSLSRIPTFGNTALYDAVQLAAKHLEKGVHEKKVLVVISDGEDNKSRQKLAEVLQKLRESKVSVYTVGLLSDDAGMWNAGPLLAMAKKALKQFAEVTGGRAFFLKDLQSVDESCRRIAHDLRNQYTIGYRPSNDKLDGSWRKITVQVNPPKGTSKVKVRAKQGYYAPAKI
jgi:Ca-activated chloride channel family protein